MGDDRRIRDLTAWMERGGRDLPWRQRRNGYTALVAEAMLQQTQVSRVVDRYRDFLKRFPTVRALAEAPEDDVLALWQGLGYYRRARSLQAAARRIVGEHGGRVPREVPVLLTLPGVGRYTAGAIASIVYGRAEPAVDGNVQRVLARWDGHDGPAGERATLERTWQRAAELAARAERPGTFNEALMELGATVCTPKAPRCTACPVARDCQARRQGRVHEIPPPRRRAAPRPVHHHAVVIVRGERMLVERRGEDGLWAGLWQTPTIEADAALGVAALTRALGDRDLRLSSITPLGSFPHRTTHRAITFHVYAGASRRRRGTWRPLDGLAALPMSNAQRKVIACFRPTPSTAATRRPS